MESCPSIKNILLLDSEGKRVAVKYYSDDWPTLSSKLAFEKSVFTKTQKTNARTEVASRGVSSESKGTDHKLEQPPTHTDHNGDMAVHHIPQSSVRRMGEIIPIANVSIAEITMFDNYIVVYKFIQDLHFFVTGGDDENELILATVLQGFFDAVALLLRNDTDKRTALENLDLILLCIDEIVDGGIILETEASVIAGKVATHGLDGSAPLSEQTLTNVIATAREHLARSLLK